MSEYNWQKLKEKDKLQVENMLRDLEETCVSACDRFINMVSERDQIWILCNKKRKIIAVIINSKNTLIPVFWGLKEIPPVKYLKGFFRKKNIHSMQGLLEDTLVLDKELYKTGRRCAESIDYDLMGLDHLPVKKTMKEPVNIILKTPNLDDIESLLPLRKGYEEEEVLTKGKAFKPEVGRILLANFIVKKRILAAQINGRFVGKIAVNAEGFSRYQIGGVYVLPEYRGRGIAGYMAYEFVNSIINKGKGVNLFVKKNNIPAKKLYLGLGFKYKGDYRINYY